MRRAFPRGARHVMPWPCLVDVEAMPGVADDDEEGEATPGVAGASPGSEGAE